MIIIISSSSRSNMYVYIYIYEFDYDNKFNSYDFRKHNLELLNNILSEG